MREVEVWQAAWDTRLHPVNSSLAWEAEMQETITLRKGPNGQPVQSEEFAVSVAAGVPESEAVVWGRFNT